MRPHGTLHVMGFSLFKSRDMNDKRRMESFMDALPFEFCGWNAMGHVSWSRNFPHLFGLNSIQNIRDIQSAILPSDAAALEGMIFALKKEAQPFTLSVKVMENQKIITLHGASGQDLDGVESYDVLWAEDTTLGYNDSQQKLEDLESLQKDVARYQSILDHLPQSIWVADDTQTIKWCNKTYAEIVGKTKRELINSPNEFQPILTGSKQKMLSDLSMAALSDNKIEKATGRLVINGKRTLLDINVIPNSEQNYTVESAYDITEQENLRAELKRYVSANAELMEQLTTAIAIFGADHSLEFYNQAFASLWGLEDQWLNTNPSLGDILEKLREMRRLPEQANFPDYKKSWISMFTSLMEQHQSMMYLPDGVALRLMVVPHPMGGLMMTFEDVTSRLELESSYNTLIAVQRETLDNLGEGVAVFGSDARLQLYNPSYLKLWNLHPEDVEKNPHISELVQKKKSFFKGRKIKWDDIKDRLTAHAIERSDIRETITRTDDTILECSAVSLPDGGVMVTYRDITDTIRVQQVLEEKNQALLDAEKLKTDFLANVSYQLRTPLNAISGFAEILDQEYFGAINDKQREYTLGIMDASNRLANLIDDILDLSSIEAGYLRLDKEDVDLVKMLDGVYDLIRDWAGMETLKIKYSKPKKSLGMFTIDERRMKQAIINIMRNAISYTPGGGTITLSLQDQKDTIAIVITDTGIGIPDDEKDSIFEPFKAITHSEQDASRPNSGLGLSLAKNIIAMHDGDIGISSILGEGTTVTITLPK